MVAISLTLGFFLVRRFQLGWRLWWIGAAGFVISQVGHIPFNMLLNTLFLRNILPLAWTQQAIGSAIIGGLSAGLWEELTRAGIYRWWADDARSWRKGLLMGAGHGGVEAIAVGLLVLGTFIYMASIRGMDLARIVPPEQIDLARQQIETYWSASWLLGMMGPLERALAIPSQIAMSILVLQAFTRKQWWWVALAVLYHALLDAAAVYFMSVWNGNAWAPYAVEGVIACFTLVSIALIFILRQPEPVETAPELPSAPPPRSAADFRIEPKETTAEDLEKSKFF